MSYLLPDTVRNVECAGVIFLHQLNRAGVGVLIFFAALLFSVAGTTATEKENTLGAEKNGDPKPAYEEKVSRTEHTVTVDGKPLHYSATAGEIVVGRPENDAEGTVFYVAYECKGTSLKDRPITFAFNGGPGAASVWLHLGCMGPRTIVLSDDGRPLPPPATYGENPYTWLSFSDLVFIDPVGTGFSRSIPDDETTGRKFYGVQQDIESVADFIRLYLTRNGRWLSPKFLVGESYGTARAAGLSSYLQERHGIDLNGMVLISPVLDFDTISIRSSNDLPYVLFLPTYVATAWYHGLGSSKKNKPLEDILNDVEAFCLNSYLVLLAKGDTLSEVEQETLAENLVSLTGLSQDLIERSRFRIGWQDFARNLHNQGNRMVGRMDATIVGVDPEPLSPHPAYDPSLDPLYGPFSTVMNAYVRQDLQFESDRVYEFLNGQVNKNWDWKSGINQQQGFVDFSGSLRQAMAINPHLNVFIAGGAYDLATPYFAARYTVDHLFVGKRKDDITVRRYPAGHMLFTHRAARKQFFNDIRLFYQETESPE